MKIDHSIILALIKNLNEGDGASLPMIDHHFFRIIDNKGVSSSITDNNQLLIEIDALRNNGLIQMNSINNFVITQEGMRWLKEHPFKS